MQACGVLLLQQLRTLGSCAILSPLRRKSSPASRYPQQSLITGLFCHRINALRSTASSARAGTESQGARYQHSTEQVAFRQSRRAIQPNIMCSQMVPRGQVFSFPLVSLHLLPESRDCQLAAFRPQWAHQ